MTPPPAPFDLERIAAGLPFGSVLDDLRAALRTGAVVVQAPAGSGKTTIVPPLVANHVTGRVVVTAPRRVVVRAGARRLSELSGRPDLVAHTVRGDSTLTGATRVEFVTPGVMLRRLAADPDLPGVAAVVLDEVHERDLDTDLLVGLLGEVRLLRDDLTLLAMSATLDAQRFADVLGPAGDPAPVVSATVPLHPLSVRYAEPPGPVLDHRGVTTEFLDHVAKQAISVSDQLAAEPTMTGQPNEGERGDVLVFLPGVWEVDRVATAVATALPGLDVLRLHGSLSAREQDRAVSGRAPGEPARVVVSTSLAESALTVPGVRAVVDSGLARQPRRDNVRGMQGLVTVTESRASADQRAGRAARLGPGLVVRCQSELAFTRMQAHGTPQIATADLTAATLLLADWGSPGGAGLRLPDPPPPRAVAEATTTLHDLGALAGDGTITRLGRRLARLPVDPPLGRALIVGADLVGSRVASEVVAMLAEELRADDLMATLAELRAGRHPRHAGWRRQARRLERDLDGARAATVHPTSPTGQPPNSAGHAVSPADQIGLVVALAYPRWIARLSGDTYRLASGTRAGLAGPALRGQEWLAVADVARGGGRAAAGTGAVIRSAAPLTEPAALLAAAPLVNDSTQITVTDAGVLAEQRRRLGALPLTVRPAVPDREQARAVVLAHLAAHRLAPLRWSEQADRLRRRLALLHRELGPPWPNVRNQALETDLTWLGPLVERLLDGTRPERLELLDALRTLLPWPGATRLDALVPERLPVPSGNTARVDYPPVGENGPPVVAVKLQECFGLAVTPRLVEGRVPVLLHLLSPAGRPLAVTDDLASFWDGPYHQVRAEMRGRYPKHPWPEDPWSAPATARTTRRQS